MKPQKLHAYKLKRFILPAIMATTLLAGCPQIAPTEEASSTTTPSNFKFYSGGILLTPPNVTRPISRITFKTDPGASVSIYNNGRDLYNHVIIANQATGLATFLLNPTLKNGTHKITATAKEPTRNPSPVSAAITLNVSGVVTDSTQPALQSQTQNPRGFPAPSLNSQTIRLNFNEALHYVDFTKIVVKKGTSVLQPTSLGLNPEDNTQVLITFAHTNYIKPNTAYTVELASGAVADLAENLFAGTVARSQTPTADTEKPTLNPLIPHKEAKDKSSISIYFNELPAAAFNPDTTKVTLYSEDEYGRGTKLALSTMPQHLSYRLILTQFKTEGRITVVYYNNKLNTAPVPRGSYRMEIEASFFKDKTNKFSERIVHDFSLR